MRLFAALTLIFVLIFALISPALTALPAHAQTPPTNSATLTEAFINAQLQANTELTDVSVDLQPGFITILGTVARNQGQLELALTLAPSVVNGQVVLDPVTLMIGGVEIDLSQWGQSAGASSARDVQALIGDAAQGGQLESIVVTDADLTVTWQRTDPNAPALALVDNAVSLTFTETSINALPAMTTPDNPDLSDLSIDFQPGQAILTGTRTLADAIQAPVVITFVPTVQNGFAVWTIQAMLEGDTPVDAAQIGQVNDDIVGSWRTFFTGLYRSGPLVNITLTDTTLTLTWDADVQNPIAFDPASGALIVTEEAINDSFRVTNPASYSISNVIVDLQPGQVVINADLNLASGSVLAEQIVFVPAVNNGFITWTVTAATLGDNPIDPAIIARFNEALAEWWNQVVWRTSADYVVTNVTVSDSAITISARSR